MMVSYNNIKTFLPEVEDVRYNLDGGQTDGRAFTRTDNQLSAMAFKSGERFQKRPKKPSDEPDMDKPLYASSSIKRAALIRTLLEREAKERGSTFLVNINDLSRQLTQDKNKILYSKASVKGGNQGFINIVQVTCGNNWLKPTKR